MALLPAVRRALRDRERRVLYTASVSFGLNLLYALYNGALGLMNCSILGIYMMKKGGKKIWHSQSW